ncbi:hypothetical protein D0N36_05010 [Hymenobacter lapidiphilus]|uniref:helix-turn-helix transcriptional regulator n=1 Tax=Hymenobacter sp. CCM 8763 TaxID=2303334 RepID=UPI000E34D675|nr:hypothetical protein [Hymenobacter sp. CCM 8763]RFP66085.1 hypothetical protein D0N36_05010 [Hymenobacter sp. CCM 8763]
MSELRQHFGLTQAQYARWLGVNRTTLALVESGRRAMPLEVGGLPAVRLELGRQGQTLDAQNRVVAVAPLPEPTPERAPLAWRLEQCQHQAGKLRFELKKLQRRATPFLNRLAALPALCAWGGPVKSAEREAQWLDAVEAEARQQLLDVCGAGPQLLLQTQLAGLEHQINALEAALAALPPAQSGPTKPPPRKPPPICLGGNRIPAQLGHAG